MRCAVSGAKFKSNAAYYRILRFIDARCRSYSGAVDRALMDGRLHLPRQITVEADAQVYRLNWISRLDRRNVELSTYCTADAESRFVLGMHANFDSSVDPFEINASAARKNELEVPEASREHAHYWLAGGRTQGRPGHEPQRCRPPGPDSADPDSLRAGRKPGGRGEHRTAAIRRLVRHAGPERRAPGSHALHHLRPLVPAPPDARRRRRPQDSGERGY